MLIWARHHDRERGYFVASLAGGIGLHAEDPNGVYGIAVAALLAISGCVYNAWVLLIEIAR